MNTKSINPKRNGGSVLVISLSVICIASIVLASYLMIVQAQTSSVSRSQSWNTTIAVSEAGLEEGLALINKGAPAIITLPMAWTNGVSSDGWITTNNGFLLTRTNGVAGTYTVLVDCSTVSGTQGPTLTSVGTVPYTAIPWIFSSVSSGSGPFLAVGGTGNSTTISTMGRKVMIQTTLNSLFSAAVVTRSNFDMSGNNCVIDSFDSSNPLYSSAGQYNVALRKSNGTLATDSSVVGDISLGNGNIYGHVMTGPGTAQSSVQVGSQGAVGTAAWQAAGGTGIEPGFWSGDFNVSIPDVPTPTFVGASLPVAVGGTITLNGGPYTTTTSPGSPLYISGPTTLWIQGSFSPAGITIATTNNASLILFVGRASGSGDSMSFAGNTTINQPGYANNLQFYGLPSLTSISINGNGGFIGTIYAPEADMSGGGGGNNVQDTAGAMIVKSCSLNGHWNFHYDEHLAAVGPSRGWIPKSWTELKYP
jgi:hypothetical protein